MFPKNVLMKEQSSSFFFAYIWQVKTGDGSNEGGSFAIFRTPRGQIPWDAKRSYLHEACEFIIEIEEAETFTVNGDELRRHIVQAFTSRVTLWHNAVRS